MELAKTVIYPAAMAYAGTLSASLSQAASLGVTFDATVLQAVARDTNALTAAVAALEAAIAKHDFASTEAHMRYCAGPLREGMDRVRAHADALETLVADEHWPLPKYRELLFIK